MTNFFKFCLLYAVSFDCFRSLLTSIVYRTGFGFPMSTNALVKGIESSLNGVFKVGKEEKKGGGKCGGGFWLCVWWAMAMGGAGEMDGIV